MPLSETSSKKSLQKNVETEINAGKDPKQAAAIAYSVQRKARAKGDSLRSMIKDTIDCLDEIDRGLRRKR